MWAEQLSSMIRGTFVCFDNAYDLFEQHLDHRSPISFHMLNCIHFHRSRMLAHLLVHYCNQPDSSHELPMYFHMVPHELMILLPNRHGTLALEAYIYKYDISLDFMNDYWKQKGVNEIACTTDSNMFGHLCRRHDPYRLDNDACKQIQWHVRIHLVLPKIDFVCFDFDFFFK